MNFMDFLKEELQMLADAGCIVDSLGLAGEFIDEKIADGTFTKCSECNRVFDTKRLVKGICELCEKRIKPKSINDLRKIWKDQNEA